MITDVVQYFKERMDFLKYSEWDSGFSYDDIPSDLYDGAYHVEFFKGEQVKMYQVGQSVNVGLIVRVFRKGFADSGKLADQGLKDVDLILRDILDSKNRTTGVVKNVELKTFELKKYSETNENSSILEINLTALTYLAV